MDYPDYSRAWQTPPFPSPVSPTPFHFPSPQQQTSSTMDPRPATLNLNLNGLSVTSPQSLSPVAPHQPQPAQFHTHQLHAHHPIPHQPHHAHAHSHSSGSSISPITPVSPQSMPLLSPQPQFPYNFDDPSPGLAPDPALSQRRSSGSLSGSSSELAVQKSVPRKRSLTSTLPVSPSAATAAHSMHQHSQSHSYSSSQALPHIITTTASSPPPPTSSTSSPSSHPSHSHSRSLSHSHSYSSLSQSHPQLEINTNPTSPYDDIDSAGPSYASLGDDPSDDDFGSPSATSFSPGGTSGNPNLKASGPSAQQAQTVLARSVGTNNFVTKLYHMINEAKAQHFITWTDLGTSFVVSNVGEFSRNILGSHFKHNNFSSFVRQLNMYGFHKINRTPRAQRTSSSSQTWEFSHPKFLRGRPDLLEAIKRKALEPDPREKNRVELPGEVARVLSELREENRALWREVRSLSSRIPQQGSASAILGSSQGSQSHISPNVLGSGHVLTHSRSSSNLGGDDGERDIDWEDEDGVNMSASCGPASGVGIGVGGSQGGEEWDSHGSRFNFWQGSGLNTNTLPFNFGVPPAGEEWKRWVESEIIKERKRVERLVGVVKALVDGTSQTTSNGAAMTMNREPDGIPPSILQELHELSLSFDASPSPSMLIPSPSPSPSPHPARHQHSPNIFITSPTSPSPYPNSHAHSRSPSRDSDTRSNPNAHTALPTLSIPNSVGAGSSQFPHPLHTPSSSPTASDFGANLFGQGSTSICHRLGGGLMVCQQPNIMLTLEMDEDGRVEKRARTDGDKVQGQVVDGSLAGVPQEAGLRGEEMDIIPNEAMEDVKLPSPTTTGAGMGMGVGGKVVGLRSRSDSAPMWGGAVSGETSPVQGGLSANWTGRGRSGSSFGQ